MSNFGWGSSNACNSSIGQNRARISTIYSYLFSLANRYSKHAIVSFVQRCLLLAEWIQTNDVTSVDSFTNGTFCEKCGWLRPRVTFKRTDQLHRQLPSQRFFSSYRVFLFQTHQIQSALSIHYWNSELFQLIITRLINVIFQRNNWQKK